MLLHLLKETMPLASVCKSSSLVPQVHLKEFFSLLSVFSVVPSSVATTLRHLSSSLATALPAGTSRYELGP